MEDLLNLVRREIDRRILLIALPRAGLITSYDPVKAAVKVQFPEEVSSAGVVQETGWMPLRLAAVGSGWGVHFAPVTGAHAYVEFLQGDPNQPVCTGFLPSLGEQPPAAQPGELWLTHSNGSTIKATNDGNVTVISHAAVAVTANGGNINVTSNTAVQITAPTINLN